MNKNLITYFDFCKEFDKQDCRYDFTPHWLNCLYIHWLGCDSFRWEDFSEDVSYISRNFTEDYSVEDAYRRFEDDFDELADTQFSRNTIAHEYFRNNSPFNYTFKCSDGSTWFIYRNF